MELSSVPVIYSLDDVRRAIDGSALAKGRSYLAQGRVDELIVAPGGATIRATVMGNRPRPYRVTGYVARRRERIALSGICSCPIGTDCKHVAAVFLAALERDATADRHAPSGANADDVDLWLYRLASSAETSPRSRDERIAYVFPDVDASEPGHRSLPVDLVVVAAAGSQTDSQHDEPRTPALRETTLALVATAKIAAGTAEDIAIARLAAALVPPSDATVALGEEVLRRIVGTGRAHAGTSAAPALRIADTRRAAFTWTLDEGGRQRLGLAIERARVLTLRPVPWYVDTATGEAGAIDAGVAPRVLATLLAAPAISPGAVARVAEIVARLGVPAPAPIDERLDAIVPVPVLTLRAPERRAIAFDVLLPADEPGATNLAELAFDYAGTLVDPTSAASEIRRLGDDHVAVVRRAFGFEQKAVERLRDFGLQPLSSRGSGAGRAQFAFPATRDARTLVFLHRYVPKLRAEGWRIQTEASFGRRVVDLARGDAWHAQASPRADGWFDLALDVVVEGKTIPLVPFLAAFSLAATADERAILRDLPDDEPYYVELGAGIAAAIPAGRLRAILATFTELEDPTPAATDRLALPRERLSALADLERDGGLVAGGDALAAISRRLAEPLDAASTIVASPAALRGTLRAYQRAGFARLQLWRELGFGGILADDMGLGKSVQTLAHLLEERDAGRLARGALVIVPTSLVQNWCDEAERFAPTLRVLALHGPARARRFAEIDDHDLIVTTYPLLLRDGILGDRTWSVVVLDEAQAIKNTNSRLARAAGRLRAEQRLALSGTPIENDLAELWSLFDFVAPGLLGDRKRFATLFRIPIEKRDDRTRRRALAARIAPFVIRRTKEHVAPELPPKTEIVRRVELEGEQRDLYESVRIAMRARVTEQIVEHGIGRSGLVVLDGLLKLRQVCCDPRLLPPSLRRDVPSAKLVLLRDMLPQLVASGRRVLVFSQFTSMLALIAAELDSLGLSHAVLTGDTGDRPAAIRRFTDREVPIFLVSLRAGGVGLNLTAADTVVHFDPWWNPAVERQATDRAHRIGQTEPVFVYKLACAGTVEEQIVALADRKAALADAILSEDPSVVPSFELDEGTIDALFGPRNGRLNDAE